MNERKVERRKSDTNIPNKVVVSRRPSRHSTTAAPQLENLTANRETFGSAPRARRHTHPVQLRTSNISKVKYADIMAIAESKNSISPRRKDELPRLSTIKAPYSQDRSYNEEHRQKPSTVTKDNYSIGLPKVEQAEEGKRLRPPVNVINSKQGCASEEKEITPENNEVTTKILVGEKPLRKSSKDEESIEPRNRRKPEREVRIISIISNASEASVDRNEIFERQQGSEESGVTSEISTHLSGLKVQKDTNGNVSIHGTGVGQINDKVKAFLLRPQPPSSPRSLRTINAFELFSRDKERHNRSKMDIKKERMIINNNTCPDMSFFDERKWYYQDKSGKCRYLRVPDTPPPPVESVFDCLHEKDE